MNVKDWKRHLDSRELPGSETMPAANLRCLSRGAIISPSGTSIQSQLQFRQERIPAAPVDLRPPLKWAGGKRWLVPYLEPMWRRYAESRLVEPFAGGLAVALGLRPGEALLNDVNPHPVNLYRWIQKGLVINKPLVNSAEAFSSNRARFNELVRASRGRTSKEAATLFYYLNRTCFNGLCRFNRAGKFNVPYGSYKTIEYRTDFRAYIPVMKNWKFAVGDFEKIDLASTDFVYADPPYDVDFTSYSKQPFGWDEQVRLAHWLARHEGPMVLSNQATDRILKLYEECGFDLCIIEDAPRMISCNGDRTPAREVLATLNL